MYHHLLRTFAAGVSRWAEEQQYSSIGRKSQDVIGCVFVCAIQTNTNADMRERERQREREIHILHAHLYAPAR